MSYWWELSGVLESGGGESASIRPHRTRSYGMTTDQRDGQGLLESINFIDVHPHIETALPHGVTACRLDLSVARESARRSVFRTGISDYSRGKEQCAVRRASSRHGGGLASESSSVSHLLWLDLTPSHAVSIFKGLRVASGLQLTRCFRHLRVARADHSVTK